MGLRTEISNVIAGAKLSLMRVFMSSAVTLCSYRLVIPLLFFRWPPALIPISAMFFSLMIVTHEQAGLVMKKFNTNPLSSDLPKTDDKLLQWNKITDYMTIWLSPDPLTLYLQWALFESTVTRWCRQASTPRRWPGLCSRSATSSGAACPQSTSCLCLKTCTSRTSCTQSKWR